MVDDPVTLTVIGASLAVAGTGASVYQGNVARKDAKSEADRARREQLDLAAKVEEDKKNSLKQTTSALLRGRQGSERQGLGTNLTGPLGVPGSNSAGKSPILPKTLLGL